MAVRRLRLQMAPMSKHLRLYDASECGADGYPLAWHDLGGGRGVKHLIRDHAGNRCVRCGHPYTDGAGEWSACDLDCRHGGPFRVPGDGCEWQLVTDEDLARDHVGVQDWRSMGPVQAHWRILTVHHLRLGDDAKRDLHEALDDSTSRSAGACRSGSPGATASTAWRGASRTSTAATATSTSSRPTAHAARSRSPCCAAPSTSSSPPTRKSDDRARAPRRRDAPCPHPDRVCSHVPAVTYGGGAGSDEHPGGRQPPGDLGPEYFARLYGPPFHTCPRLQAPQARRRRPRP
jgi:hypothetical protein